MKVKLSHIFIPRRKKILSYFFKRSYRAEETCKQYAFFQIKSQHMFYLLWSRLSLLSNGNENIKNGDNLTKSLLQVFILLVDFQVIKIINLINGRISGLSGVVMIFNYYLSTFRPRTWSFSRLQKWREKREI